MYGNKEVLLEEILQAIRQQTTAMINCFNAVNQINNKLAEIENLLKEKDGE